MSMSALISALRGAGRQQLAAGTTVTTTQVTGSYLLRIDGCTLKTAINDTLVKSGTFGVGGHDWRILCYPNGAWLYRGWLSLYLERANHSKTGDAMADVRMSILDHDGKTITTKSGGRKFSGPDDRCGWDEFVETEALDKEKRLKDDDNLSILCDVIVYDTRAADYRAGLTPTGTVVPLSELHQQLAVVLWESKEGVDVEIEVGGETFAAHRWMLAARSPAFKAELALTTATNRLHIDDMDAAVFKAMLLFIYTDALPKELELATMAKPLLVAADRYKLERLKLICEEELCGHIGVQSVAAMLALAEQNSCRVLKEACTGFLSEPGNLKAAMATGDFEQLKTGCHPALMELLMKQYIAAIEA
ncbi:BTB/POZ and MATH domain-containing protein 2-like [Aegilops tauschii subsp. strangulata]|uniref:Speckle-type POZ protein-like protein n=3 Tax=Aegilops tauschii TaxID=37682 RepID=A0A452XVG3_AEGTS|nr:BTB/POZ and MATH domain-containing protein 2-like [Aegilops tauschii subsp. strangulata]